ncbi:hypothetical protein BJ508DRAFT_17915 [Ascobolus immersus RN42]|uniref:Uncharacterized protein n=1 Tax=Ascobolus immersus RN42 TaxID=1160509 RepID=A0A3N4HNX9_ASCIM|nr:hypothetical protein BJ508DRAFT_17915 [Ascobolus immersus RN42]
MVWRELLENCGRLPIVLRTMQEKKGSRRLEFVVKIVGFLGNSINPPPPAAPRCTHTQPAVTKGFFPTKFPLTRTTFTTNRSFHQAAFSPKQTSPTSNLHDQTIFTTTSSPPNKLHRQTFSPPNNHHHQANISTKQPSPPKQPSSPKQPSPPNEPPKHQPHSSSHLHP